MLTIRKIIAFWVPSALIAILALSLVNRADVSAQEVLTLPIAPADSTATPGPTIPAASATETPPVTRTAAEEEAAQEKIYKSDARALSEAFRYAAREATPAVVTVYSYGQNSQQPDPQDDVPGDDESLLPDDETFGPAPPPKTEDEGYPLTGLGSGVVVELMPASKRATSGTEEPAIAQTFWVMTNNHVIADAKRVVVQFPDQSELVAQNVYGDRDSDIAVLQLSSKNDLAIATMGDSDTIEIGDWVLAIGSPFKLEATVCAGIISAKHRSISKIRRGRLFQTDAAINPGNSGGPLVDLDGEVVAISTAIATRNGGYQGIGFAIPINQARWIANELAEFQRVRRAAMGVTLTDLNPKLAKDLNLPTYLGVLISQVIRGSAAEAAGLQSADVILEFAGQRVQRARAMQQVVEQQPVGSTQDIKILRSGQELTKQIVLAPSEDPTAAKTETPSE